MMEEGRWKREIHMGHSFYDLPAGVALVLLDITCMNTWTSHRPFN